MNCRQIRLLSFIATMLLGTPVVAESVVWGGVSLATIGDSISDQQSAYPAASEMMYCTARSNGCPYGSLNEIARTHLAAKPLGPLDIVMTSVASGSLQGNILSPVIAGEMVLEGYEGSDAGYSYTYMIFVNLMVLRFEAGKTEYVSSYPFILRWLDFKPKRQTRDEQTSVMRSMYASNTLGFNLFEELAKAASKGLKLTHEDSRLVAITDISVSDEVGAILEKTYSRDAWSQQIANVFEANLAMATGQPMLPSKLGKEGRNTLNLVFEDASRKLDIPAPAYKIAIDLERFVRDDVQSGGEHLACFMVATRFRVTDPFEDEIVNVRMVRGEESCTEMKSGMIREDRVYFPESLLSQLSQLADYFGKKGEKSFLARSIHDQPGAIKAMAVARKTLFGVK